MAIAMCSVVWHCVHQINERECKSTAFLRNMQIFLVKSEKKCNFAGEMKRILFIFIALLNTLVFYAQYRTQVLNSSIRTLRMRYLSEALEPSGNAIRPYLILPENGVIDGSEVENTLEISFDEMSHDVKQFSYTILHCNYDWTPSTISSYEYVEGFTSVDIVDYAQSINTQQSYTHYTFVFPNNDMQLTASGNYVLLIYEDGDVEKTVAEVCFSVVEPLVGIDANVRYNTDIELNGRYQQLDIDIQTSSLNVRDVQEVKLVVQQNGRWDNRVVVDKPTFIEPNRLRYISQKALIFEGGNEFRHFDAYSTYYAGYHVDAVRYGQGEYHVFLDVDEVRGTMHKMAGREGTVYLSEQDADGQFVVNCEKAENVDTEAEYVWVNFILPVTHPLIDANLFVGGDIFYNQYTMDNMMYYDSGEKCYLARAYIKQGGYNYMYYAVKAIGQVQMRGSRAEASLLPIEGSHWQTKNEYSVRVYYRPFGGRYDRLVGCKVM